MSAWVDGKLELKCSLNILRKAIINIMPEWEEHLIVDPEGNIPMYRFNGERAYKGKGGDKDVHLLIPGNKHPGVEAPPSRRAHNDWGFKRASDGGWEVTYADYGLNQAKELENRIKGEVTIMKAKAIATMRGYDVIGNGETEDEKFIDVRVDASLYEQLQ